MGRVWQETYPLLDLSNPNVRALAQAINQALREGTVWNVQHPYWHSRKGVGGGSPLVNNPPQLMPQPENLAHASWSLENTPVLTAAQADPFGGFQAYLINDNDGALVESIFATVTFTADGTKSFSVYMRAGSSVESELALRDQTAGVSRHRFRVVWTAGVPTNGGTLEGTGTVVIELVPNSGGWYRISSTATSVVAANVNVVRLRPTTATGTATGDAYFFGVNAWNSAVPRAAYRGPSNPGPTGNPNGQIGNLLYIRGASASITAWLRQGDIFQVPGCQVVFDASAQIDTDAAGGAVISINPPIFEGSSPLDGAALELNPGSIFFRAVITDVQDFPDIDSSSYINAGMQLTWREMLQ
jgi:hypothetical protein